MISSIHEFSPILTGDGVVWIVHGRIDSNGGYVCRPKYLPDVYGNILIGGRTYTRLHSPVFKRMDAPLLSAWPKYNASGIYQSLYVIGEKDIVEKYRYTDPPQDRTETARKASELLREIVSAAGIPSAEIGFIGSLILHSETDGYSDIDLAFSSEDALKKALAVMEKIPSIHLRSADEWRSFYHDMKVQGIREDDFVRSRAGTKLQGMYSGIPFSVFLIRKHMLSFPRHSGIDVPVEKKGILRPGNGGAYNYPVNGTLAAADGDYNVLIWDRSFVSLNIFDRPTTLHGVLNGRDIILSPAYNNLTFNEGE